MKKILPIIFALCLGASACSKNEDPQPASAAAQTGLTGKWAGVSARTVVTTTASGATVSDQTVNFTPGSYSIELTATEFLVYAGATVDKRYTYTKNGNVLVMTSDNLTIQEQTASRLVLFKSVPSSSTQTQATTYVYSR